MVRMLRNWYAAGTQLVRSWYAAGQPWYALVRTVWYALVRIGTHLVRIGTDWYASGTHLVRIWYASGTQLIGTHVTHLVRI